MNRDIAILADGREVQVSDLPKGTLFVLCHLGQVQRIRHFTAPRSKSAGTFRKAQSRSLTASQTECLEGAA